MDLDTAIKERHSVRSFKTKNKASWKDAIKAIDAANYSPLAGNIQTLKFILVSDKERIRQLAEASQQSFVQDASHVIIVCSDLTFISKAYGDRADMYTRQQAGAAIQNILLELTNLGLGACWVGAFVDDNVKRIVGIQIDADINIEALIPIGYEMNKSRPKREKNLDNILYFDKWKNKKMRPPSLTDD